MELNEYLLTVVGAATVGICADILNNAFSARHNGLGKYIKFGITLCILSCMIIPIFNILRSADIETGKYNFEVERENRSNSESLYILENECALKITERITEETGIKPMDVSIELEMKEGVPCIVKAEVTIPSGNSQSDKIQEIVSSSLGTNNFVITEK